MRVLNGIHMSILPYPQLEKLGYSHDGMYSIMHMIEACVCGLDAVTVMWDHYFTETDPFFFFFLALVMVVNAK